MSGLKTFRLFVDLDGTIYTKTIDYSSGMFNVDVKAKNIRHAKALVCNEVYPSKPRGEPGIIDIDASYRKVKNWPYRKFKPKWWDSDIIG